MKKTVVITANESEEILAALKEQIQNEVKDCTVSEYLHISPDVDIDTEVVVINPCNDLKSLVTEIKKSQDSKNRLTTFIITSINKLTITNALFSKRVKFDSKELKFIENNYTEEAA
ncbi:MAG: hypothetical protein U0V72_00565 [Cytophagales bacterium]